MCLTVRVKAKEIGKDGFPVPNKAEEDIKVYKLLEKPKTGSKVYNSPFHKGDYERGYHYYQVPDKKTNANGFGIKKRLIHSVTGEIIFEINEGLHVYLEKPKELDYNFGKPFEYIEMIMPKDTLYYTEQRGNIIDIVCNNLIFPEK